VLRNIFASMRDEIVGYKKRWHNEDFRDPYCLAMLFW